jgi:hypothetical protein
VNLVLGNLKKISSFDIRDSVPMLKKRFSSLSILKAVKEDDLDSIGDNEITKMDMVDDNSDRHFM